MTKGLLVKIMLYWLVFVPVAILNGTIRVYGYQPLMGELIAHQISSLTAIILFLGMIYVFVRWNRHQANLKNMLVTGLIWIVLTILFEFGFGHYVMGHSWQKLLFDYNLFAGRLWLFVLLTVLIGPLLVSQKMRRSE